MMALSKMSAVRKNGGRKESAMGAQFRADLLCAFPHSAMCYKIPDTFGTGGMRPFDCFAVINGKAFVFEFKRGHLLKTTDYQSYWLDLSRKAGAHVFVVNETNRVSVLDQVRDIAAARR